MITLQKKKKLVLIIFLFLLSFTLLNNPLKTEPRFIDGEINSLNVNSENNGETIIEGKPIYRTVDAGDNYVDSTTNAIFGSQISAPPSGMGQDNTLSTSLTEESYETSSWITLMTQASFSSLPSDWSALNIDYAGGYFSNEDTSSSGEIICKDVSTSTYETVKFTIYLSHSKMGGSSGYVYVDFCDSDENWDEMGSIAVDTSGTRVFTSTNSQYQHSKFKARVRYSSFTAGVNFLSGNNWVIEGENVITGHRLGMIYAFTGLDDNTFTSERLIIDFDSLTSSEGLDIRFESGDPSPDYLLLNDINSDVNINIHGHINDPTCYISIFDHDQANDGDTDIWRIDRLYIQLTNAKPINSQTPVCTNLDTGNYLYARSKRYDFSVKVSDNDGATHLDLVELRSFDSTHSTLRWGVRFFENTETFTSINDNVELSGSSYYRNGNTLELTFRLYIEWEHPDTTNDCLYQFARDDEGDYDADFYQVGYNYETRLKITDNDVDDGVGLAGRGNINGYFYATGTVSYVGTTISPPNDAVDVWLSADLVSESGPWADTILSNGDFSILASADNEPGFDKYAFRIVPEGAGYDGIDLQYLIASVNYVSDRIVVESLYGSDNRINIDESSSCFIGLRYEYSNTQVTDADVSINGITANYTGIGGTYSFSETKSSSQVVTYDSVSVLDNVYGISEVNQNGQILNQFWDRVIVVDYSTSDSRINTGDIAKINVSLEYESDGTNVTSGSVTVDGVSANYITGNIWQISVSDSSATANTYSNVVVSGDNYGITDINQNSQEITVIWDSVTITLTNPLDQRIELGENATGIAISGIYDYDGQEFTGVFTLNNSEFTYSSVGKRGYTVSSITGDIYGITTISLNDETYCIWDAIEVYNLYSPEWVNVNESFTISCQARSLYDGHLLGIDDQIYIDFELATWNDSHFILMRSYSTVGGRYFSITSGYENSFVISVLGNSPETLTHVTDNLIVTNIESDFSPNNDLYVGVYNEDCLWIHWDPLNDPTAPNITFTIDGAYISYWNVSSSFTDVELLTGTAAGDFFCYLEDELVYSHDNFTYTILVLSEEGSTYSVTVNILVTDYISPTITSPIDISITEGNSGVNIIWTGSDIHPYQYIISQNNTELITGNWNSSSEYIIQSIDNVPCGNYLYTISLYDEFGNSIQDSVDVTISDRTAPTINSPSDISFSEGDTGLTIMWNGNDLHPFSYVINRNSVLLKSGDWNSSAESFIMTLDGLNEGEYTYEIILYDTSGNFIQDSVDVTVTLISNPTTTSITESSESSSETSEVSSTETTLIISEDSSTEKPTAVTSSTDQTTTNKPGSSPGFELPLISLGLCFILFLRRKKK